MKIPRRQYVDLFGPTVGDRIRLADTELLVEVEQDLTTPGEEAKFGGGKSHSGWNGTIPNCHASRRFIGRGRDERGYSRLLGHRQSGYRHP